MDSVRNTSHYVDMRGDKAFLSSEKFLVAVCVTLQNVAQTLCFSNSPIKRKYTPTDRTKGCPINVAETSLFFEKSLRRKWTAHLRSMLLLNGVPSWTYGELYFMVSPWLPECYENQNGQLKRLHPYNQYYNYNNWGVCQMHQSWERGFRGRRQKSYPLPQEGWEVVCGTNHWLWRRRRQSGVPADLAHRIVAAFWTCCWRREHQSRLLLGIWSRNQHNALICAFSVTSETRVPKRRTATYKQRHTRWLLELSQGIGLVLSSFEIQHLIAATRSLASWPSLHCTQLQSARRGHCYAPLYLLQNHLFWQ